MEKKPYRSLGLTVGIHFIIMYALTFAAVNTISDAKLFNLRSFYMAVVMVAPMVILMLLFMRGMFTNKKLTAWLYAVSGILFVLSLLFIRQQTFVGNEQFLRSMIPHHSAAITMCQEAHLTDERIQDLCQEIITSQQQEIKQMNDLLEQ